jgi:triosephosphate isomerase
MALPRPHFLVNYKLYEGTAGADGLALARSIESVQERTGASFVVAPQTPDLARVAEATRLAVVAPGVDALDPGRGTGRIALQTVAAAGADGVLVNHPEHQTTLADVAATVDRCDDYDLASVVTVRGVDQGRAVLAFDPDWLVFEEPDDIATDRAITRAHPDRVEAFLEMVDDVAPGTNVLLGGGISTAADVLAAFELGADAAGAASAVIEADDREAWLTGVAEAMPAADPS